jgi:predicted dehydrogenase
VIHHLDIAHWAMGMEYTGPIEISAQAEFPAPWSGLWDVHGKFSTEMRYPNGVRMYCFEVSQDKPDGLLMTGTEGWIFVAYGTYNITASDQTTITSQKTLIASDPKILAWKPGPNDIHIEESPEHHLNWLSCVRSRKQPLTNVEIAHRTTSACLLQHIAMKVPRKLYWDPIREHFKNDDEANAMLSRAQRYPYNIN